MKSVFALAAVAAADDCSTNELKCRAAVVTTPTCFAFKTNVVTDKNKDAEFTVTKIEAKYPDDVNNYVINQQNSLGRLFYEVGFPQRARAKSFRLKQLKQS